MDSSALQSSQDHRRLAIDTSLRYRIHRFLLHSKWRLSASSKKMQQARRTFGSRTGLLWGTGDHS